MTKQRIIASVITATIAASVCARAFAQESIADCSELKGIGYYHFAGIVPKEKSGFEADRIDGGVVRLVRSASGEYDILYIDSWKKPISHRHDGAVIELMRRGSSDATFLVVNPGNVIELYTFYRDKAGARRLDVLSSKGGDGMLIHKSSVMTATCSDLRLDLVK